MPIAIEAFGNRMIDLSPAPNQSEHEKTCSEDDEAD
jgi:hypothetical protein